MAVYADASTLLALASIGKLHILKKIFGTVFITKEIKAEVMFKDKPHRHVIKEALDEWIKIKRSKRRKKPPQIPGLGPGEKSIFDNYTKGDLLIIDDALARRTARAKGYEFTGLLGILISGVKEGILTQREAIEILDALASSKFHMSAALYLEVKERIEG